MGEALPDDGSELCEDILLPETESSAGVALLGRSCFGARSGSSPLTLLGPAWLARFTVGDFGETKLGVLVRVEGSCDPCVGLAGDVGLAAPVGALDAVDTTEPDLLCLAGEILGAGWSSGVPLA